MATPRKRWWRACDSLAKDNLENDQLACLIRLASHLNTRWARDGLNGETAGRTELSPGDLMALAGCASLARARRVLSGLAERVSLIVTERGARTVVEWPKFPIFQGWVSDPGEVSGPPDAPSASASASAPATRERRAPSAPSLSRSASPPEPDRAVAEAVELLRVAFGFYGREVIELSPARCQLIGRALEHVGGKARKLAGAVHGYVARHTTRSDTFDPWEHFTVETVLKPENLAKNLDAFLTRRRRGETVPFDGCVIRPTAAALEAKKRSRSAERPLGGGLVVDSTFQEDHRV